MILNSMGKPINNDNSNSNNLCSYCGFDIKNSKPVLGGKMVCMKCVNTTSKEKQNAYS